MSLRITFVGTGDAFGAGGRFNTCFLIDTPDSRIAVDFGATSLVAL
ncbi:MAG: MBL fold metallo-hydrolase, partial [Alphaproteobacteria bacterium]|nr:MBL fold metallo-hydrolase [Alphaproteobacteria bacterium]